jgi:RNA polymerase sigma factor (sigma-70 family)
MTPTANAAGQLAAMVLPNVSATGFTYAEREALYQDFRPLIQRLVGQYGDDPELRQDLQGEIYCRFCDLLDAYDPARGVPLKPFLVRTLTASVYTYARRQWQRRRREISLSWEDTFNAGNAATEHETSWDEGLVKQQFLQLLPYGIAHLPRRQQQIVIWRYYDERSYEEIASQLSVQVPTARSLLRHAHNNLRRFFVKSNLID